MLNNFWETIFPKQCLSCEREGEYLCPDCRAILDVSRSHQSSPTGPLADLYFPLSYQNKLLQNLIKKFKYEPFVKELSKPLHYLIIEHLELLDKKPDFSDFVIMPVPLAKKRQKWRGFNQAEEMSIDLAASLKIPVFKQLLIKTKETPEQVSLAGPNRKENLQGAFSLKNSFLIKNEKVLLVDDVYTTGATLKECARLLREAGAKKVVGLVLARAEPGQDIM